MPAVDIAALGEQLAIVTMRLGIVGQEPERRFEVLFRQIEVALLHVEIAEIIVRHTIVRLDRNRLQRGFDRFIDPALLRVGVGQIVVARRTRTRNFLQRPVHDHAGGNRGSKERERA